jgi:hypothetical protein
MCFSYFGCVKILEHNHSSQVVKDRVAPFLARYNLKMIRSENAKCSIG